MCAANVGAREEVSMSRHAERDGCTNSMHRGATAVFAANLGPEVRRSQSAARDFRDDVSTMYQKAAMFSTGSRDEAVRRGRAITSLGPREVPNAMYERAAAVCEFYLGELR